jgi:hypothetical protein
MDDSQSPPDADSRAGSRKGDPVHRSSIGLREAEEEAATRPDMLGDGSPIEPQEQSRAAAASEPSEWRHPAAQESVNGDAPHMPAAAAPDRFNPPETAPEAAPEPGQSLDAFIDSIPADPPSPLAGQTSRKRVTDAGFPVPPERYQVSAIFEGLRARRQHTEEARGAQGSLEAADVDGDAASLGAGTSEAADNPATPLTQSASTQADDAAPAYGVPLFYQPVASAPMPEPSDWLPLEAPAGDDAGNDSGGREADAADDRPPGQADTSEWPPLPAAGANSAAEPAPFPQPADWPPPMPLADAQADDESHARPPSPGSARDGGVEPFPEPLGWPPFPEAPGSEGADAAVEPLKPPSLVTGKLDASDSPFPAPPAWPPFPDSAGDDSGPFAQTPSGLPPYIELPAHLDMEEQTASGPADRAEASARSEPLRFAGPRAEMPPAFDDLRAAPAPRNPREVPRFHNKEAGDPAAGEPAAKASAAASAKIEAEANATAQALDNLQRLLSRTAAPAAPLPPQQPFRPQAATHRPHNPHFRLPQDDPYVHDMAPMLPLPVLPDEDADDRRVYVLGFLTGLVLSVMAGAALYFLINFG